MSMSVWCEPLFNTTVAVAVI